MFDLDNEISKTYEKFKGLPNGAPIVRAKFKDDAFPIVALKVIYNNQIEEIETADILTLAKYVVAPPDSGIDIVVQRDDVEVDVRHFDIIQVKNYGLKPSEIKKEIMYMKRTIVDYLKKPQSVNTHLKQVLSDLDFGKDDEKNCSYIVIHRGQAKYYQGLDEKSESVITGTDLENIMNADSENPRVPYDEFKSDQFNNFISYEEAEDTPAILINLCGYGLGELSARYDNTVQGRNILFGQNLREGLEKSNTSKGMFETIRNEPEKFWFYNNGITILAEDYNIIYHTTQQKNTKQQKKIDKVVLKNFSIINGAQTTSTLGRFYKEADLNNDTKDIECLKKVFVLTRILKVNDDKLMKKIARYNNTQNPITSRDLASVRPEQEDLYKKLKDGNPPIYVNIRRGMKKPGAIFFAKHRCTNNEELAQLAFAGFQRDPSSAKNQKKSLFDYDSNSGYDVNESYHKIFDKNKGVLFSKSNDEIDELLFIYELYKRTKTKLTKEYQKRIDELSAGQFSDKEIERNRLMFQKRQAITRKCVFFCLTYYYSLKANYPLVDKDMVYRYNDFYNDNQFVDKITKKFIELFLEPTVNLIFDLTKSVNSLDDWIRGKRTEDFVNAINDKLGADLNIRNKYQDEYVNIFMAKKLL